MPDSWPRRAISTENRERIQGVSNRFSLCGEKTSGPELVKIGMLRRISIIAAFIYGLALPAKGVDVVIANAGFEQVMLPCAPGASCSSPFNVDTWAGTGIFATLKPSTGPGEIFSNGVPEGVNVAVLGNDSGNGVLVQTLVATLQPNTIYKLTFSVGSRADYLFTGYSVELLAGSTTLALDSSLSTASGTFVTGRIVYSSTPANPVLLGQPLGIRLTGNAKGQAAFDRISLEASTIMVSNSARQIASGGGWKTMISLSSMQNSSANITVTSVSGAGVVQVQNSPLGPLTWVIPSNLGGGGCGSGIERSCEPTIDLQFNVPFHSLPFPGSSSYTLFNIYDRNGGISNQIIVANTAPGGNGEIILFSDPSLINPNLPAPNGGRASTATEGVDGLQIGQQIRTAGGERLIISFQFH